MTTKDNIGAPIAVLRVWRWIDRHYPGFSHEERISWHFDDDAPETTTLGEWIAANAETMMTEEVETVLTGQEYIGGGGATPLYYVRLASTLKAQDAEGSR